MYRIEHYKRGALEIVRMTTATNRQPQASRTRPAGCHAFCGDNVCPMSLHSVLHCCYGCSRLGSCNVHCRKASETKTARRETKP